MKSIVFGKLVKNGVDQVSFQKRYLAKTKLQLVKTWCLINPVYVCMYILELCTSIIYDFYYNYIHNMVIKLNYYLQIGAVQIMKLKQIM